MKTYFAVFKMRLLNDLQYRAVALAGIASKFFWGLMYVLIYQAFYKNFTGTEPISVFNAALSSTTAVFFDAC